MKVLGPVQAALIGVTALIASMATVVPVSASAPSVSSPPQAVAATTHVRADFDGDGRSDTAVAINPFNGPNAPEYTPGVRVWLSANRSHPSDFLYGAGGLPRANGLIWPLASGNFNGDAYADLAMVAGDGTGVVLYGSPTGLGNPREFDLPTDDGGGGIESGAAADVNGDGYDDLVVMSSNVPTGSVTVFDGSAAGLSSSSAQQLLGMARTSLVGVGDLNGDGYDDVAVTGGSDCATITQEECNAAIVTLDGSAAGLRQPADSAVGFGIGGPLNSGIGHVPSVQIADFNQDGYDDIAVGTPAGEVAIFRGGPAGLASKPSTFLAVGGSPDAVGDVNGDGFPDLALSGGVGGVPHSARATVLLGSPAGLRTAGAVVIKASQLDVPGGSNAALQVVGLLDVTGDGKADLVADASGHRMFYLPATASGFSPRGLTAYSTHGFGQIAVGRLTPKSHTAAAAVSSADVTSRSAMATAAGQSPRHVTGDVNGDGFPDLVIGDPGADAGSISTAGQVVVVPGSAQGFRYAQAQTISAASPGVPGDAVSGDEFGTSVAVGDFNGDGFADVAIDVLNAPVPGEKVYFGRTENVLDIVYGGPSGLRGDGPTPAMSIVDGATDNGPAPSLAAGDFDGNGSDDLAVADALYRHQLKDEVCSKGDALGRILVFNGSRAGLVTAPDVHTGGCALGVGSTLLATDLDHDGRTDLVAAGFTIRIANQFNEDDGGDLEPGASRVETMYGGPGGLTAIRKRHANAIAQLTFFPAALGIGDVNGDGHSDIVVGIPSKFDDGVIDVLLGHGRRFGQAHRISQATAGVPKHSRVGSEFGLTVAVGRVNAGRFADIVVGVPFARANGKGSAGRLLVLYSGRHGFRHHAAVIDQSSRGIGGATSAGNEFGFTVALRRSAGHTTGQLLIGVPGANHDAGGVVTLRTTRRGLTTRHAEWTRERGVGLPVEAFDLLGYTFA
jgi:hypothetical protein